MRPLIVGEAPSRTSDPKKPLSGRCGRRLATLCGLDRRAFERRFALANVCKDYPGRAVKGARFDRLAAEFSASFLKPRLRAGRVVVLLGFRVARAFRVRPTYFVLQRVALRNAYVYVVPHPSGVNKWWNDPSNIERASRFFKKLARYGELPIVRCVRCGRTWSSGDEPILARCPCGGFLKR